MNRTNNRILITGGTGLIGDELTKQLIKKGYQVSHNKGKTQHVNTFLWDINPTVQSLPSGLLHFGF